MSHGGASSGGATIPGELGEALLQFGAKALISAIPAGGILRIAAEELAMPFGRATWDFLRSLSEARRDRALRELASLPWTRAKALLEGLLHESTLEPDVKKQICGMLAAVPQAVGQRGALLSPSDGPGAVLTRTPDPVQLLASLIPHRPLMFESGTRLANQDYVLEQPLGQGGQGEVWLARNLYLPSARPVAVKFIQDPNLLGGLRRELTILNALGERPGEHGIVEVLGSSLDSSPAFVIYDYVRGGTLRDWLSCYGAPPPMAKVLSVLREIARPLAYAHGRGVVHRDLKPSNILVSTDRQLRLTDFGIGTRVHVGGSAPTRLDADTRLLTSGTALYVDPNRGHASASAKDDIYAFGVIAYQLLVADTTRSVPPDWAEHVREVHPEFPHDLHSVIADCLARPTRRIEDGARLVERLASVTVPAAAIVKRTLTAGAARSEQVPGTVDPAEAADKTRPVSTFRSVIRFLGMVLAPLPGAFVAVLVFGPPERSALGKGVAAVSALLLAFAITQAARLSAGRARGYWRACALVQVCWLSIGVGMGGGWALLLAGGVFAVAHRWLRRVHGLSGEPRSDKQLRPQPKS